MTAAAMLKRTSTDLDAAHLLASIAAQMTAKEDEATATAAVGTCGLVESPSSPDKTGDEEEVEAPPSPRLTYLCTVVDRQEDGNRDRGTRIARSALDDHHRGRHVPRFASLQRGGGPMMPPPALLPPMTMGSSSPEQDYMTSDLRTRTISVDTADSDSYLAPDLAYLRTKYESGRLSGSGGVPDTFVSVPTIISPPSSPSAGSRRRPTTTSTTSTGSMDPPTAHATVRSPKRRKKKHDDSSAPREVLVDAFLEDEDEEDNYVDAGANANDEDDEEYLPTAQRARSRKPKHKSHGAAVPSGGSSSSRPKSARTARKNVYIPATTLLKHHKGTIQPAQSLQPRCSHKGEGNPKFRIVLREKFSWKLYPEVSS